MVLGRANRRRGYSASFATAVVATVGAAAFARTWRSCSAETFVAGREVPRSQWTLLRVEGSKAPAAAPLTWKEALEVAKTLEAELLRCTETANQACRTAEAFFSEPDPIRGGVYCRADGPQEVVAPWSPVVGMLLGMARATQKQGEEVPLPPVLPQPTSVLAGRYPAAGPLAGRFANPSELALPEGLPFSLTEIQSDGSAEEELWRSSCTLLVETLDQKAWPRAKAAIAALREAEHRAEERRDAVVVKFRHRVESQVAEAFSLDHESAQEVVQKLLAQAQGDPLALSSLSLLELFTLEGEELSEKLAEEVDKEEASRPGSVDRFRSRAAQEHLEEEIKRLHEKIKSSCKSVAPAGQASSPFGAFFDGLKGLR